MDRQMEIDFEANFEDRFWSKKWQ